jgi:hypothetical protein
LIVNANEKVTSFEDESESGNDFENGFENESETWIETWTWFSIGSFLEADYQGWWRASVFSRSTFAADARVVSRRLA